MAKERPLIFSAEMVRKILAGEKTQTRRVVRPQPIDLDEPWPNDHSHITWAEIDDATAYYVQCDLCPYGKPGDQLWVREALRRAYLANSYIARYSADDSIAHNLDNKGYPLVWHWKNSKLPTIHMPRRASRLTLEIVSIEAEPLQSISEAEAKAEGFVCVEEFALYWDKLNAKHGHSWASNPWVWIIKFAQSPMQVADWLTHRKEEYRAYLRGYIREGRDSMRANHPQRTVDETVPLVWSEVGYSLTRRFDLPHDEEYRQVFFDVFREEYPNG